MLHKKLSLATLDVYVGKVRVRTMSSPTKHVGPAGNQCETSASLADLMRAITKRSHPDLLRAKYPEAADRNEKDCRLLMASYPPSKPSIAIRRS